MSNNQSNTFSGPWYFIISDGTIPHNQEKWLFLFAHSFLLHVFTTLQYESHGEGEAVEIALSKATMVLGPRRKQTINS